MELKLCNNNLFPPHFQILTVFSHLVLSCNEDGSLMQKVQHIVYIKPKTPKGSSVISKREQPQLSLEVVMKYVVIGLFIMGF